MISQTNQVITGEYDWQGDSVIYADTDSCLGSTLITTETGEIAIEDLFNSCDEFWQHGSKEYARDNSIRVLSYDTENEYLGHINYIYRHLVDKKVYDVHCSNGSVVSVTEDHSVMVDKHGELSEVKPMELSAGDILITYSIAGCKKEIVTKVNEHPLTEPVYVYDIGMANEHHPWFFGNGILLHNSVYFSAVPVLPADQKLDAESAVEMYDTITEIVTETFAEFMQKSFNTTLEAGAIIRAGREAVARRGLFVTKKRYALLLDDLEGKKYPKGKLKAMGLDLKRSDTPVFVQDFLEGILIKALDGSEEAEVIQDIRDFKKQFRDMDPWGLGTPKRVNNLTMYTNKVVAKSQTSVTNNTRKQSLTVPGHVTASINWNNLRRAFADNYSMQITDGAKVIVCKLKANPMGYNSIAYPIDEKQLPEWFRDLPFDVEAMEEGIVDKKVDNVIGATGWDLSQSKLSEAVNQFFNFG